MRAGTALNFEGRVRIPLPTRMSIKERPMPHSPLARRLPRLSKRSLLGASLLAMLCAALPHQQAHAQGPRNFATLAMVAEPQTLDPMASTADLVGHHHAARVRAALHLRRKLECGADAGREPAQDLGRRQDLQPSPCARA
jgi:hypothetical protein